jgi:endonuclease YncB( thermonuclease family)
MKKKFILILLLAIMLAKWGNAQIFQWRDDNGQIHYSDRQHADAVQIKVNPGYTYYEVKKVYDGDTILLKNKMKVRFLGINTPEVEGRHKAAEPGGDAAKKWLTKIVSGNKIRLQMDMEKKDKYGRILAHVFTDEGLHINLELVRLGLAMVNIHPPNLAFTEQLLKAQQQAQIRKLGVWGRKEYAARPISSILSGGHKGWRRLIGRVSGVHNSRKFSYLEFSKKIDARIDRRFLSLFPDLEYYVGKELEISGWPSKRKGHYSVLIRHPGAIKVLN